MRQSTGEAEHWLPADSWLTRARSGDATPCRMIGVTLHSHVRYIRKCRAPQTRSELDQVSSMRCLPTQLNDTHNSGLSARFPFARPAPVQSPSRYTTVWVVNRTYSIPRKTPSRVRGVGSRVYCNALNPTPRTLKP